MTKYLIKEEIKEIKEKETKLIMLCIYFLHGEEKVHQELTNLLNSDKAHLLSKNTVKELTYLLNKEQSRINVIV